MSFKENVLEYLRVNGNKNLDVELVPYQKKLEIALRREDNNWANTCNGRIKAIEKRRNVLEAVLLEMERQLNWNTDTSEVKDYLSEYGTFCDRYTLFYDKKIEDRPIEEAAQILLCEYINSIQDYFVGRLTDKSLRKTKSVSLISFYHIGQIKENKFAWYSQSGRSEVFENFFKKYPECNGKYIVFEVNKNAVNYLFNKMVFNDPEERLGKVNKLETSEVLEVIYFEYAFQITSYQWQRYYRDLWKVNSKYHSIDEIHRVYYKKGLGDNDYERIHPLKKIVKENKEYINLAKTLSK